MNYQTLLSRVTAHICVGKSGSAEEELCARVLGVPLAEIRENVIITPGWGPEKVTSLGNAEKIGTSGALFESYQVWNIENGGIEITYIKTGFGAPMIMDALLPLGLSGCKRILFLSSIGGLAAGMEIGDVVLPQVSVSGDGASRYLASDALEDVFGESFRPDEALFRRLWTETEKICTGNRVGWHLGTTFCTDTILAQFAHMDYILKTGCNTLDMESAVAFRTAKMMGKPLAALMSVSDNSCAEKSLIGKRPQEEIEYRQFVRRELMPQIILNLFRTCGSGEN